MGKNKVAGIEVLDDNFRIELDVGDELNMGPDLDFDLDFDEPDDDEKLAIQKWTENNVKVIGNTKVTKGTLFGKKMVQWDLIPRCDPAIVLQLGEEIEKIELRLSKVTEDKKVQAILKELESAEMKRDSFGSVSEVCELDYKGRCPYRKGNRNVRDPKCTIVDKMMQAHRQEVFHTYMDLDQDSYNQIGLELLPLYVLQCRLNILISSQPIMHASGSGNSAKASPLLKENRRVQQSIRDIRNKLDEKKAKLRPVGSGSGTGNKGLDPLDGR